MHKSELRLPARDRFTVEIMVKCDSETCEIPKQSQSAAQSDYIPPLSVLEGLKLLELPGKTEIQSQSLWSGQGCLIYLVRRPGCVLCRVKS